MLEIGTKVRIINKHYFESNPEVKGLTGTVVEPDQYQQDFEMSIVFDEIDDVYFANMHEVEVVNA